METRGLQTFPSTKLIICLKVSSKFIRQINAVWVPVHPEAGDGEFKRRIHRPRYKLEFTRVNLKPTKLPSKQSVGMALVRMPLLLTYVSKQRGREVRTCNS